MGFHDKKKIILTMELGGRVSRKPISEAGKIKLHVM